MTAYFNHAIMRLPSANAGDGLTTAELGRPDHELLFQQHAAYCQLLRNLGLKVEMLDALPNHPDAYFVEDTAIVFPELAVIARSGASSRRGEETTIETALARHKSTKSIQEPATIDGGDVLVIGKDCFVGLSSRTNRLGASQLAALIKPLGYTTTTIDVSGGLHLKSLVNYLGDGRIITASSISSHPAFKKFHKHVVHDSEQYAANTLWINDCLLTPVGFPSTMTMLSQLGLTIHELNVSEIRKMDGGLTCLSLRI